MTRAFASRIPGAIALALAVAACVHMAEKPSTPAAPPQIAALPLAAALKAALDRSGLFYESHLVQWFAGERPLAALLACAGVLAHRAIGSFGAA